MSDVAVWVRAAAAIATIALVLAALRFVLRLVQRGFALPRFGNRLIDVVESAPLAHASVLHVVRIAERYYAIGGGQGYLALICEVPAEAVAARHRMA